MKLGAQGEEGKGRVGSGRGVSGRGVGVESQSPTRMLKVSTSIDLPARAAGC